MKSQILFALAATILLAILLPQLHATTEEQNRSNELSSTKSEETSVSLQGLGRFLADTPRGVMTCDKYPRVCRAKGSSGPDCCNKHCVNLSTDKLNCSKCGRKCRYSEICCQGICVKPSVNEKHCGRCNKGSSCVYGLCSYA